MATVRVNGYPTHIIFTRDMPRGNEQAEAKQLFSALVNNLNGTTYDYLFKLMKRYYNSEVDPDGNEYETFDDSED